jgi:hypothetical protein
VDILAGIFAAALLQDLAYTSKTALVSRGHRRLAVAADVSAMLTSSLYLILAASVTMRSGLSIATVEAFAAIAIGGACGTIGGMFAVDCLEKRFALGRPMPIYRRSDFNLNPGPPKLTPLNKGSCRIHRHRVAPCPEANRTHRPELGRGILVLGLPRSRLPRTLSAAPFPT